MDNKERVFEILNVLSGVEGFDEKSSLTDDLYMDSLEMVMLLIEIEDEFDILIDESDMNPFDLVSVSDVVGLVDRYCERKENGYEES